MVDSVTGVFTTWARDLTRLAMNEFNNMGPQEYGCVLICVGLVGWFILSCRMKH